jgi:hypothetical protein
LVASAGVAVTYGAVRVLGSMSWVLVLIGVAFFFALGLEPAASWLVNRKLPRWLAVTLVVVVTFTLVAGSVAAAIPLLAEQARQFVEQAPHYLQQAKDHSSVIGRLNDRFHLQQRITDTLNGSGGPAFAGLVKAGSAVFGALAHLGVVAVLTVYFLADMRRIRTTLYRLVPRSRRPRAILLGDEVLAKVGAYFLGNVATSSLIVRSISVGLASRPRARNGNEGPRRRCISVHLRAQRRLSDTGASALHIHQSNEDRRGLQPDSNPRSPPHLRKSGHPVARQREGGAETPGPQDRDPNVGPLRPPIPRRLGCRGQRFRCRS